jgi:cyclopropane-fatty-acyl-phospholipid synthase
MTPQAQIQPGSAYLGNEQNGAVPDGTSDSAPDGTLWRFLKALPARAKIPLRVLLWNGKSIELGPGARVTLQLKDAKALGYLLQPSIDNLAEGYVGGHFDLGGTVDDIVDVAMQLAATGESGSAKFARLFTTVRHNKALDKSSVSHHYDVSNAFYQAWLDPHMVYSCAYYQSGTESLHDAQLAKLDHVLNKLLLKKDELLLDIGCGWGALAIRAAQKYGARVVGVTLSDNQYRLARERVAQAGFSERVDIRLLDYRDLSSRDGQFDKITSIGMFEHVGLKHLGAYFTKINSLLKDGGLVLNHGITSTDPGSGSTPLGAGKFIDKYVFPNGELPHVSLALQEMQVGGIEALDVECLRRHYARTLWHWSQNFEAQSDSLRARVNEKTWRIWRIYLAGCAYAFTQNWVSLYQVLGCKAGSNSGLNPTPWSRAYMYL